MSNLINTTTTNTTAFTIADVVAIFGDRLHSVGHGQAHLDVPATENLDDAGTVLFDESDQSITFTDDDGEDMGWIGSLSTAVEEFAA